MALAVSNGAPSVDRVFHTSLLLLVANGYLALLPSGQIDPLTAALLGYALLHRLARVYGLIKIELPKRWATVAAAVCIVFYPIDALYLSQDFVPATLRLMFLVTAIKLSIASSGRDYFYLGLLGFLHLLSASMFIAGVSYLGVLLAFLILSVISYCSYEIKRGCESGKRLFHDGRPHAWEGIGKRLAGLSIVVAGGILLLSFVLFLALPRMLSGPTLPSVRGDFSIGFSPEVNLGLTGSLRPDYTPVMRVEALDGSDVSGLRWRGLALRHFDGVRWTNPEARSELVDGSADSALLPGWRRSQRGALLRYRVMLEPFALDTLFVAGLPEKITGNFTHLLLTDTDSFKIPGTAASSVRYEVTSFLSDRAGFQRANVVELFSGRFESRYLQVPEHDPRVEQLALSIGAGQRSMLGRAEEIERYLKTNYSYTLDLPESAPRDPIAHFLFDRRRGHCEYFASSMALMLRIIGIPSRLVNGFHGGVANPISKLHVIRSSDAHSWVEAYLPGYGWMEFDPTPPDPNLLSGPWMMQAWMFWDAVQSGWSSWVVDYGVQDQMRLVRKVQSETHDAAWNALAVIEWLQQSSGEIWDKLRSQAKAIASTGDRWPVLAGLLMIPALLAGSVLGGRWLSNEYRRRRLLRGRFSDSDSAYFYLRATQLLERRGLVRRHSQTPDEFASGLQDSTPVELLRQITQVYNAARFGGDVGAARELPLLVRRLEQSRT